MSRLQKSKILRVEDLNKLKLNIVLDAVKIFDFERVKKSN